MTTPNFREDLIAELFGEQPSLAFLGNLGQANLPRSAEDFFRSRTSDFLQRFQQAAGQQLVQGQLPSLTPEQFFGDIDFNQERFRFSPSQRGMGINQFAPPTRFLRR